jgi:hypothetical protein
MSGTAAESWKDLFLIGCEKFVMPFSVEDGNGVQALEHNQYQRRMNNGVHSGCGVSPGTNNLTVKCDSGTAIIDGSSVDVPSQDDVSLSSANGSDPRKDTVYLDASGNLSVKTGVAEPAKPSGKSHADTYQPQPPDMADVTGLVLAEVWIPAGASDIGSSDIRDRRLTGSPTFEGLSVTDFAAKETPWADVTHPAFGAAGDGSTDDTDAIQSAIDHVGTKGTVIFPPGTYSLQFSGNSSKLSLSYDDMTLLGFEGGSQLHIDSDPGSVNAVLDVTGNYVNFQRLWIQSFLSGLGAGAAPPMILANDCSHLRMHSCRILSSTSHENESLLRMRDGNGHRIQYCSFERGDINIDTTYNSNRANDIVLDHIVTFRGNSHGIDIDASTQPDGIILRNWKSDNEGKNVFNAINSVISGFHIEQADTDALDVGAGVTSKISNGHIANPQATGLFVSSNGLTVDDVKVINPNRSDTAAKGGIDLTNGVSKCLVSGVHVREPASTTYSNFSVRATDGNNIISGLVHKAGGIIDGGPRNLFNGVGENSGEPSSTGDWNGNGFDGAIVRDTSNNQTYIFIRGSWHQL